MFDSKQTLTTRLADATDLLIDFATLGEYGLEPVGSARQGCETRRPLPIAERSSFNEVLFPNQCNSRTRGSGPKLSRKRGRRGASLATSAGGAA